jgi:hypothetical protein
MVARGVVLAAALLLSAMSLSVGQAPVRCEEPAPSCGDSRPELLRRIPFGPYGSKYARLGDLTGDGKPEVLLVQVSATGGEHKAVITCLTAVDLEGNVLWQVGQPDPGNVYFGSDFPVQVHDLDRDGSNEVVYIRDERNVLTILAGASGKVLREVPLAGGHDSLLFADFSGNGHAQDLLVKDRYTSFWVYDKDFRLLWSKRDCNPGHYPMEYDVDGDGRDELLCGYALYDDSGKELWSRDLGGHNDAVYIADMDGDGKPEIGIAASDGSPSQQHVLLDVDGNVLFRKTADHSQHALIGRFRPDLPGKQICFIDRQVHHEGGPVKLSELSMFTKGGRKLLSVGGNIWYLAGEVIENWLGRPGEDCIGLYSRGFGPPCILDGFGRPIATFPLPEAILEQGSGPEGKDVYDDFYMQHLDFVGDDREEIFCYNHKALYVWTNGAASDRPNPSRPKPMPQMPRLYNNNFYPGRL